MCACACVHRFGDCGRARGGMRFRAAVAVCSFRFRQRLYKYQYRSPSGSVSIAVRSDIRPFRFGIRPIRYPSVPISFRSDIRSFRYPSDSISVSFRYIYIGCDAHAPFRRGGGGARRRRRRGSRDRRRRRCRRYRCRGGAARADRQHLSLIHI